MPHDTPGLLLSVSRGCDSGARMISDRSFLERLGVGDLVIVESRSGQYVEKVTHATATQIHVGKSKYRRKDGREIGADMWYGRDLAEATPELLAEVRAANKHARLVQSIRDLVDADALRKASIPALEAIHAALTKVGLGAATAERDET